jgi:3-hydroxyacyl-CoA dehydrogenase
MTQITVRADRHNGIAVLTIDHPPVNAMAQPVRAALLEAVVAADADVGVAAIVITASGRHFVAGADIREFDAEPRAPLLNDVTRRMGKLGVVVGNCFGFVGNRMLYAYGRENQFLMLEGATPAAIDSVLEKFGMAMGPNAVGDLAGLDVGYRVRRERRDLTCDPRYYRVADMLVEAGRLGQKTGRGAYLYTQGSRKPMRDVEVEALIAAESQRLGIERRAIADQEIRERCLFGLINEGAFILSEGIAATPADIDVIWCNGYGFPRFRGGPMFYADTIGPATVLDGINRLAAVHGRQYWTPAPLLSEIAGDGGSFQGWQNAKASMAGNL